VNLKNKNVLVSSDTVLEASGRLAMEKGRQ
jgi:hypothetical protein